MDIKVEVIRTIYQKNDYSVIKCNPLEVVPPEYLQDKSVTIVGTDLPKSVGLKIEVTGEWEKGKYGWSFKALAYSVLVTLDRTGIIAYLGTIKGVGPVTAKRIYDGLGDNAISIIEHEPERLKNIPHISKKTADIIAAEVKESPQKQRSMKILLGLGLSTQKAKKAIRIAGVDAGAEVARNPFFLCQIDRGMFRKAEEISFQQHVAEHTSDRVLYGVLYVLKRDIAKNGDLFLEYNTLISDTSAVFKSPVHEEAIVAAIELAQKQKLLAIVKTSCRAVVYPYNLYQAERQVALSIAQLLSYDNGKKDTEINNAIKAAQQNLSFVLDKGQVEAIKRTLSHNVSIITGGPGTGKTTILKVLVSAFRTLYPSTNLILAAPTGRAARKMNEDSGYKASTLHSAFHIHSSSENKDENGENNEEDEDDEDELNNEIVSIKDNQFAKIIIIDESSMMDILICSHVVRTLSPESRIVFIGDVDQLPSVGPGNVLNDMIQSKIIPVSFLTIIHRQAEESRIVLNADRINHGDPELAQDKDFRIYCKSSEESEAFLIRCYQRALKIGTPPLEVQILTPYRKKDVICSTSSFNTKLQKLLNPSSPQKQEIAIGDRIFREGDKIIQGKNCSSQNQEDDSSDDTEDKYIPRNGDIGIITKIQDGKITIDFSGNMVTCDKQYLRDFKVDLGYAITIHKSQGSEFQIILMPIISQHLFMLRRKIIYTAITRASKRVVIAGQKWVLKEGIKKVDDDKRNTFLEKRLVSNFNHLQKQKQEKKMA